MNDEFVVFHSGIDENPELGFRLSCGMLPAHSIPVAMCYGRTVIIIGSPHFYVNEVLEYVASVRGIPATAEQIADAKTGRVHVFELAIKTTSFETAEKHNQITVAVHNFLARGAERVEIVATTRGAVSHCDIEVQDEPMWQVRGEFPQVQVVLAQPIAGLFDNED